MYKPSCMFCNIARKESPANIRYEDDDLIVFDNILQWVPVMLLVIPKEHHTQQEFWSNPLLHTAGKIAVEMGKHYSPDGFRILANFGWQAMQSQEHGHIHVVGGTHLGEYVRRSSSMW